MPSRLFMLLSLFALTASTFSACSLGSKTVLDKDKPVFAKDSKGFPVESVMDSTKRDLLKYPTKFDVPLSDGNASLNRAIFFFKTYTSSFQPQAINPDQENISITSEKSVDSTRYRLSRITQNNRHIYSVAAAAKGNKEAGKLAAANLARFIKEGQLEVSLIK